MLSRDEQIVAMWKYGASGKQIARRFNLTTQRVFQILKAAKAEGRRERMARRLNETLALRREGKTKREIAKQLGLEEGTIGQYLWLAGLIEQRG